MKLIVVLILTVLALVQGRAVTEEKRSRVLSTSDGSKIVCFHCDDDADTEWYSTAVFYQIYPKSFKDSNNDGIGDLQGIAEKLVHLKDLGVAGVWLSPIFKSPQKDGGYDISDYYQVDPIFGTMQDMEHLILTAKRLKIKLILDFVPNHTSDQHQWFIDSENGVAPYEDYYIWNQGINCREEPWEEEDGVPCDYPNNWLSVFGGSAWTWNWKRNKFIFHQFAVEQPDLNFHNPRVGEELKNILRFWMTKGIDGFRVDAINHAYEDPELRDEVLLDPENGDPSNWGDYYHNYTKDWPESYYLVYDWRDVLDEFSYIREMEPKVMMTEAYSLTFEGQFKWFGEGRRLGSHIAFNFILIGDLGPDSSAADFAEKINEWISMVPAGNTPNWVAGNHDNKRLASKWGEERVETMAFVILTLPGIGVVYQGEELGMVDHREISWEDTQDPSACNTNETFYKEVSRDPARTPFHWDDSENAGFNDGHKTWLPVHPDYEKLNLKLQKAAEKSVYKLYQNLIRLRKLKVFSHGKSVIKSFFSTNVLGILRYLEKDNEYYAVVINLSKEREIVDLTLLDPERTIDLKQGVVILTTNNYESDELHPIVRTTNFNLDAHQAAIVKLIPDD